MTPDLASLADRVEQAEGPSRELDAEIAIHALGWKLWRSKHGYWNFDGPDGEHFNTFGLTQKLGRKTQHYDTPPLAYLADEAGLPAWTAGIDAALTLLPSNHVWWEVQKTHAEDSPMRNFGGKHGPFVGRVGMNWGDAGFRAYADQPARAILAAILRARSQP